ncbi:signal peptidase I [Actinoplanes sp. NPDC023801]|uniref:signal peptidase I n=1 Tax=Actinoplanes sp. NPDC023801 TaxID=3154595 RepID=UPI0033E19004
MKRVAYRVLRFAVRGRRERGGPWGEAVLAEFDHVTSTGAALRWAFGGLRVALRERYSSHPARYRLAAMALATLAAVPLLVTVHYVPSHAMEPTITVTSRHIVDQVAFRVTGIDHGDIVAFSPPDAPSSYRALSRVIGVAGDRVECREGKVLRDGAALDEPYLPLDAQVAGTECTTVTVPEGAIYVLGDNRDAALDSRHWGVIRADEVTGRVIV